MIDLRSDTVTKPTPSMRRAMFEAEVGDDVYGDDPTVNQLESRAAKMLGKEAGLFVPSGSMGNLVSLLTHCGRGAQAIVGSQSHIYHYEQGGAAALGGIHLRTIENEKDGTLPLEKIDEAIEPEDLHYPHTRLLCLENTWNGIPLSLQYTKQVAGIASIHGLKMHLDGARLFNASVSLKTPAKELAAPFDSVTFCLSKGLAAPVGSVVCGSAEFIHEARRNRKLVGGGMRQAGILAAAGIVALEEMIDRLVEDHANARKLAEGLSLIPGIEIDMNSVRTNMVFLKVNRDIAGMTADQFVERLETQGIVIFTAGRDTIRAVTHYSITESDIDKTIAAFKTVAAQPSRSAV